MNYAAHYEKLIERARARVIEGYSERHHIIPRCMGGSDAKTNLVRLTPEEHFLAHLLLLKMYPNHYGVCASVIILSKSRMGVPVRNNKIFGWVRRRHARFMSERMTGRVVSAEQRERIAESLRGRPLTQSHRDACSAARIGYKMPEETRAKMRKIRSEACATPEFKKMMSDRWLGKKKSPEARRKMSLAKRGRKLSAEHRAKLVGKKHSDETRRRMSESQKARYEREWLHEIGIAAVNMQTRQSTEAPRESNNAA